MRTTSLFLTSFLFFNFYSFSQWTQVTMPRPNVQFTAAALEGKVYFAGGNLIESGFTNIVDIYDVENNTWSIDSLSEAKVFAAPTAIDGKIFFGGGITAFGTPFSFTDQVDVFNTELNSWSNITLSKKKLTTAVTNGNKVFFAGGIIFASLSSGFLRTTDIVDIYNLESGELSTATLSKERGFLGTAAANDIVLFVGGQETGLGEVSSVIDIYDSKMDSWSTAELSEPRAWVKAIALGDKIFIAGGVNENGASDRVDIYNTLDGSWSVANLSLARGGIGAAVIGEKIYFVGGGDGDIETNFFTSASSRIDIYDNFTDTWSTDELSFPRLNHVVTSVDNKLIVAGGLSSIDPQVVSDVIEIFTDTTAVTSLKNVPKSVEFTIFPNPTSGKIFVELPIQKDYNKYDLLITSLDGVEILRQALSSHTKEIDISNLVRGNYLVSLIETTTGKIDTQRIVVD